MCVNVWFQFANGQGNRVETCGELAAMFGCKVRELEILPEFDIIIPLPAQCLCGIDITKSAHQNKFVIRPYSNADDEAIPYSDWVVLPKRNTLN